MKEQRPYIIIGIVGLTIKLLSQLSYCPLGIKEVWYIGDALAWLLIIVSIRSLVKEEFMYTVLSFFVGLSLNNLFDEVFFDPSKLQWNEAVFALIGLIWLIYKTRKKWRKKK